MSYVIIKKSRSYTGGDGYQGQTWEKAGLEIPKEPFRDRARAEEAAEALTLANAVGFEVVRYWSPF